MRFQKQGRDGPSPGQLENVTAAEVHSAWLQEEKSCGNCVVGSVCVQISPLFLKVGLTGADPLLLLARYFYGPTCSEFL